MKKYRVYYEHTNSTGGKTTGFKDISASSVLDACTKFDKVHDSSYKVTKVEEIDTE